MGVTLLMTALFDIFIVACPLCCYLLVYAFHPSLFEIQLPVGVNDAELEERIIQHLAAAAAMGRARHYARREGHRGRSSTQGRQHFLVFSPPPDAQAGTSPEEGLGESLRPTSIAPPSSPLRIGGETSPSTSSPNCPTQRSVVSTSGTSALAAMQQSSPSSSGSVWFDPILYLGTWLCV